MTDELFLRASDNDRSRVTNFLSDSLAKGFITTDEIRSRIEKALSAKTFSDLLPIVSDIPGGKALVKDAASSHIQHANPYAHVRHQYPLDAKPLGDLRRRTGRASRLPVIAVALMAFFAIGALPIFVKLLFFVFSPIFFIGMTVLMFRMLVHLARGPRCRRRLF